MFALILSFIGIFGNPPNWDVEECKKHCEPLFYHPHHPNYEIEAHVLKHETLELHAIRHLSCFDFEFTIMLQNKNKTKHDVVPKLFKPDHQPFNICATLHL